MNSYRLKPALWAKNRNKLIVNQALVWGSGVLVGILISYLQQPPQSVTDVAAWLITFGIFAVLYGSVAVFFTVMNVKKARKRYESFELFLAEDLITRKQFNMPEIRIRREEVTRVQEVQEKGFIVRTGDPVNLLWVPDELIGYEDVTRTLLQWAPAEAPRTSMPLMFNTRASVVISMIGMLAIFLLRNAVVVTFVALPYVGFMLYAAIYGLRSPNRSDSGLKIVSTTAIATVFIVMRVMTVWR